MSRSCADRLMNWFLGAGLGSIFGVHELRENMDKNTEMKMIEKYLMPHLLRWWVGRNVSHIMRWVEEKYLFWHRWVERCIYVPHGTLVSYWEMPHVTLMSTVSVQKMCCVGARLCEQALRLSVCVCGCVWCGVCVCRCVCVVWCVWYGVYLRVCVCVVWCASVSVAVLDWWRCRWHASTALRTSLGTSCQTGIWRWAGPWPPSSARWASTSRPAAAYLSGCRASSWRTSEASRSRGHARLRPR